MLFVILGRKLEAEVFQQFQISAEEHATGS